MTASERQTRVMDAALRLLLLRNGPGATLTDEELAHCANLAATLERKVESALGLKEPF